MEIGIADMKFLFYTKDGRRFELQKFTKYLSSFRECQLMD